MRRTKAMRYSQNSVAVLSLAALLGLLLLLASGTASADAPNGPPVGGSAPAFVLPDLQGRPIRLENYKGQIVVLNFWAFWCDTWKAEMPSLKELSEQQGDLGFRLLAISVDGTRRAEFDKLTGGDVPFPVLLDGGGHISARYRVHHVPTVVIIGPDGVVCFTAYGYPGNRVILRELRKVSLKTASLETTSQSIASAKAAGSYPTRRRRGMPQ